MNDLNQDNLIFRLFPSFTYPYLSLMRMDRPIGFLLLFYPISFVLVSIEKINLNTLKYLILFFIGSIAMRSAGCIINDIFDIDIDKKVKRTKSRPLASSKIPISNAVYLLFFLLSISLLVLINLNIQSIILGLVIIPLVILYPLAKRYFILPQLVLAMTYNWGCLIGWVTIDAPYGFKKIFILYLSLIIWTIIYDTIYATQDELEDRKMNLYSSTIFFDKYRFLIINLLVTIKYVLIIFFGYLLNYNFLYYLLIILTLTINLLDINFIWENKSINSSSYFKRNNYYGILILFIIMVGSQI